MSLRLSAVCPAAWIAFIAPVYRRARLLVSPTISGVQVTDQQRPTQAPRVDRARPLLSALQLAGPALDRPARDVARAEAESQRDRDGDGAEQASEGEIDDLVRQAHLP